MILFLPTIKINIILLFVYYFFPRHNNNKLILKRMFLHLFTQLTYGLMYLINIHTNNNYKNV